MLSNDDETISVVITTFDDKQNATKGGVDEEDMSCRSATFQEVTISLQPPSDDTADRELADVARIGNNPTDKKSGSGKWSFINRVKRLPNMISKIGARGGSDRNERSAHSQEPDSDSGDADVSPSRKMLRSPSVSKRPSLTPSQINLAAIGLPLFQLKNALSSSSKKQAPKKHTAGNESPLFDRRSGENSKQVRFQKRIDRWSRTLHAAIHEDMRGNTQEALNQYRKFNIKTTKETITFFEQFTCDQQKLLRQIMNALDRRCNKLKSRLRTDAESDSENVNDDSTLADLQQSLSFLSTIKTIGSGKTMPVVLVYQEKKHRKKHRDEQKGKSNNIRFAREKRDFLQHMGLPETMITEQGIDFTVMPKITTEVERPASPKLGSRANSQDSFVTALQFPPPNRSSTDGTANRSNNTSSNQLDLNFAPVLQERKLSLVDRCLGLGKRFHSSPSTPSLTDFENNYKPSNTMSVEEWIDNEISKTDLKESVSLLSCDSCSSSESVESNYEMDTDTAVRANHKHREFTFLPPTRDPNETYLVLAFEKVGVKKTNIEAPFLRVSIRDNNGSLLSDEQETSCWDVINRNYLRATSPVFVQESMESLPDDFCLFFEVRHHIPSKRKVCTHSYTFIERAELQNGEFVCEMYKPPVDYTKAQFIPYSEKALFLHLDIRFEINEVEPKTDEAVENVAINLNDLSENSKLRKL